jgi:hypothetical protein
MSEWLARLKNEMASDSQATKPTKPLSSGQKQGFVGFVACVNDDIQKKYAANDPDRWCWPNSPAMNTAEIANFQERIAQFTQKGLSYDSAEQVADKLVFRDREWDDRRMCLECEHMKGYWRCGNKQLLNFVSLDLSLDLVMKLQRCTGFLVTRT